MRRPILAVLAFVSVLAAQYPPSTNARSLQGRRISSTAPNNIEVLAYLSATGQWTPTGLGAGGLDLITGASTLTTTSVIPRVSAAGVLGPSKLVCTGSPVTCTLYDDTAVTGSTRLVVRAGAADPTTAPLGAELVTNGAFTTDLSGWTVGANWGWNAGTALHTAGSVETLAQNISVTNATTYQVEFKISGRTAGGVTVTIGAVTLICYPWDSSFTENGTWQRTLVASGTGSQALTFTPTLAFDGALDDVTVKAITGPIPSLLEWRNAANAVVIEARGDAALSNSAMGLSALQYNTTGFYNSAQGVRALYSNTTGYGNSAQGVNALLSNTTGSHNSAQGVEALRSNTTGYYNSAQGGDALYSNTTGYYNSAQGVSALRSNTTGIYNSAQGMSALQSNTTGSYNSAQGVNALLSNTTGYGNSAQGVNALLSNTTGYNNSAQGVSALYSNTSGYYNSAQGVDALYYNTTGDHNSAQGVGALRSNTTGFYNSAQGVRALYSNTTGNDNSAQGVEAGYTETPANANVSGSQNVWIGYQSGPGVVTQLDNSIGVGYRSHPMASNHAVFGNSSITLTTLYGRVEMGTEAKWANGVEGTCDATNRGRVVMVQGGVGVADTYRICSKDAADAYAWRSLQ